MRICHLTPQTGFAIPVAKSLVKAAAYANLDLSQAIKTFGNECRKDYMANLSIETLTKDRADTLPVHSSSSQLWQHLDDYDIVHIYRLFSHFGLYCAVVAKSMGKVVVGFDHWRSYHPIMINTGLGLINGFHAIDDLAATIIPSIYSGPIQRAAIDDNMDGTIMLEFYRKLLCV